MEQFAGRVVIVTGGSQESARDQPGVDEAAGRDLRLHAVDVAPAARTEEERDRCMHVAADVRDGAQIEAVRGCVDRFGRLDVLINNAGGQPPADTATVSPRFIRAIIELNLTAPMIFARRRTGDGRAARGRLHRQHLQPGLNARVAGAALPLRRSEAGLNHMTRSLGRAWGRKVPNACRSAGSAPRPCWLVIDGRRATAIRRTTSRSAAWAPRRRSAESASSSRPTPLLHQRRPSGPTGVAASDRSGCQVSSS